MAVLGLSTFGPCTLQAYAEVAVEASLSHPSFPQDKAAMLTIMVTGKSRNATVELPKIDNILLHNQGQSSQISVVNGSISSSISHRYLVQAVKAGSYSIPSIKVTVSMIPNGHAFFEFLFDIRSPCCCSKGRQPIHVMNNLIGN